MIDFIEDESIISFEVNVEGFKVEEILKKEFGVSSRLFTSMVKNRAVFLNGEKANRHKLAMIGDTIVIIIPDEDDMNIPDTEMMIDIIYEDLDLVIINKPPNTVVHPTRGHPYGTILNGMVNYFKKNDIRKKVRFANRLDKDTSGVLIIAKNSFGHQQISNQLQNGTIKKEYIAIVNGVVENDEGIIEEPIEREYEDSIKRIVREDGKYSLTKYTVIERYKNTTLLKVNIETGRTHQIRVHLEHIGHAIVGDELYGQKSELINRQALHSHYLKFKSPRVGEYKEVVAKLPCDILNLISIAKEKEI